MSRVLAALRVGLRLAALWALLLVIVPAQWVLLRLHGGSLSSALPQAFHRIACRILGLQVQVEGMPCAARRTVFVANHLSHLDVLALGSVLRASFVAKDEIDTWPVFGMLCRLQQTVFVSRDPRAARDATTALLGALNAGRSLVLFPEGTSSDGCQVMPFKSSAFSLFAEPGMQDVQLQPVSIELVSVDGCDPDNGLRDLYAYHGDAVLVPHLLAFMGQRGARLRLVFHPPMVVHSGSDRKSLARLAHATVASSLPNPCESECPFTPPARVGDPAQFEPAASEPTRAARRWLWWLATLGSIAGASWLLSRQLHGLSWRALADAWRSTSPATLVSSLVFVAVSFACLGAYEVFAVRSTVGRRVPSGRAFSIGLVGHALSNTLGFALLTGTAFRARAYKQFGVGAGELARLLVRVCACVAMGVAACLLWAAMVQPASRAPAAVLIVAAVLGWVALRSGVANGGGPTLRRVASQGEGLLAMLPLAVLEMLAMMAALWVLLPGSVQFQPSAFALLFIAAMLAGLLAHAPGGLGVFEAVMLTSAPAGQAAQLLAALLLYRALYNLVPFVIAVTALALHAGPTRALRTRDDTAQFEGG